MKPYKIMDFMVYKLGVYERRRDKRSYNQLLKTMQYLATEIEKIKPQGTAPSGKWNNNIFNKGKYEKKAK